MNINIKLVTSNKDKKICFSIRQKVFIEEQKIDKKIESDDDRIESICFLASIRDIYVGTARYRQTDIGIKLERFAVLKSYRYLGVGKSLVHYMVKYLKNESYIYLYAQHNVIDFYSKLGFDAIGNRFKEAEIPHQKMIYNQNIETSS